MRPPEVFVRELAPDEGARLKSISNDGAHRESHLRTVIHAFNEQGFDSLDPDDRGETDSA